MGNALHILQKVDKLFRWICNWSRDTEKNIILIFWGHHFYIIYCIIPYSNWSLIHTKVKLLTYINNINKWSYIIINYHEPGRRGWSDREYVPIEKGACFLVLCLWVRAVSSYLPRSESIIHIMYFYLIYVLHFTSIAIYQLFLWVILMLMFCYTLVTKMLSHEL